MKWNKLIYRDRSWMTIGCIFIQSVVLVIIWGFTMRTANAQSSSLAAWDTLDRYDLHHHKTGYWRIYFDCWLNSVRTVDHACFFAYQLYEDGFPIFPVMHSHGRATSLEVDGRTSVNGEVVMLDGTYRLFTKKERKLTECVFSNGILRRLVTYHKNGQSIEGVDFTRPYKEEPNTAYFFIKRKDGGIVLEGHWRKVNGLWDGYKDD